MILWEFYVNLPVDMLGFLTWALSQGEEKIHIYYRDDLEINTCLWDSSSRREPALFWDSNFAKFNKTCDVRSAACVCVLLCESGIYENIDVSTAWGRKSFKNLHSLG